MTSDKRLSGPTIDLDAIKSALALTPDIIEGARRAARQWAEMADAVSKAWQPLVQTLGEIFKDARKADAVLDAGWVPFPGLPVAQIGDDAAPEAINELMERFTRSDWAGIKERLRAAVIASGVDQEAVATFDEALQTHEAGLYRSTVRVVFPEIERVARETVYGGQRREAPKKGHSKGSLMTSLGDFREAVSEKLPAGVAVSVTHAFTIIGKMNAHFYEHVGEDEASLNVFRNDPVPNRHASQHAFVTYSSHQHSMNSLAMACFMFQIIMQSQAYIERMSLGPAEGEPT